VIFYYVNCNEPKYFPTLHAAAKHLKARVAGNPTEARWAEIEELEIGSDRKTLLAILNDSGGFVKVTRGRWSIGPQGGVIKGAAPGL